MEVIWANEGEDELRLVRIDQGTYLAVWGQGMQGWVGVAMTGIQAIESKSTMSCAVLG